MELPLSVIAGAIAVGLAIPLLILGFVPKRDAADDPVLKNLGANLHAADERQRRLEESTFARVVRPAIKVLANRARRITPAGWLDALDRRLRLAGSPGPWTLERILAVKVVTALLGFAIAALYLASDLTGVSLFIGIGAGASGYFIPDIILWGRAQERQAAITLALPDTLDQMTISVEAGLGFDAALQRVAATSKGPLAQELGRFLNDIKLGVNRLQALKHLANRTDVPELHHFVYAIRQADEFGLPVSEVLRTQAAELRVKRRQRAEERALKMPVKILFPLVTCIFPTLFVVLLGPAVIQIRETLF